jgi:RNA polymerase sigma factor (sigma-70 family)
MTNLETRGMERAAGGELHGDDVPTDAELLARWSAGNDRGALEQLVRRHGGMVFGVCRRVLGNAADADDAFQATFLVLVRKARSLASPDQVAGWLYRVALRVARKARADRARRHGREVTIVDLAAPTQPDDSCDLREVLDEELDRLPEKYRLPIVLCELEGRTLEEAARLLGWPKGTVAGRLSRGRDLLRRRLSRRRGLVLPLFLIAGPAAPDPLISATLETVTESATNGTGPVSRPAALADSALRTRGRRSGLLALLILTAGVLAAIAWHAQAATVRSPSPSPAPDSPTAPAMPVAPTAPTGGCHHS